MEEDKEDSTTKLLDAIKDSRKAIINYNSTCALVTLNYESANFRSQLTALQVLFDTLLAIDALNQKEMEYRNKIANKTHVGEFLLTIGIGIIAIGIALPDVLTESIGLFLILIAGLAFLAMSMNFEPMNENFKREIINIKKKLEETVTVESANNQKEIERAWNSFVQDEGLSKTIEKKP